MPNPARHSSRVLPTLHFLIFYADPLHAKIALLKDIANVTPGIEEMPKWHQKEEILEQAQAMAELVFQEQRERVTFTLSLLLCCFAGLACICASRLICTSCLSNHVRNAHTWNIFLPAYNVGALSCTSCRASRRGRRTCIRERYSSGDRQ